MSTGTSNSFFLSFHKRKRILPTFLAQTKSECVPCDIFCFWTLLQQVQLFSLFKSLQFNFLCLQQKYIIKQEEIFREIKIKIVHDVSFIDKNPYFTNI